MNRQAQIWISMVAGLALAALLLLASHYTVIASPEPSAGSGHNLDSPSASSSAIAWSSGWVTISQGACPVFQHNLGGNPDDYAVELWSLDTDEGIGINRANYGGLEFNGDWHGAHWQNLTVNTIRVCRHQDDRGADQVRIRVWAPPAAPDFDSTWTVITPGHAIVFSHNLGITNTDLTVSLWFQDIAGVPPGDLTNRGIHHFSYGGLAVDPNPPTHTGMMLGAHWHNLTDNSIRVTRHLTDTNVDQVRVVIVHGAEPDYDSLEDPSIGGWQPIAPGTEFTFTHNLNWNPDMLLVRGSVFPPHWASTSCWLEAIMTGSSAGKVFTCRT